MTPLRILATITAFAAVAVYSAPKAEARGLRLGLGIGLVGIAAISAVNAYDRRRAEEERRRVAFIEARRAERARQAQIARARVATVTTARAKTGTIQREKMKAAALLADEVEQTSDPVRVDSVPQLVASAPAVATETPAIDVAPAASVTAEPVIAPQSQELSGTEKNGETCQRYLPTAGITIIVPCSQ